MTSCIQSNLPPWSPVSIDPHPITIRRTVLRIVHNESEAPIAESPRRRSSLRRSIRTPCYVVPVTFDGTEVRAPATNVPRIVAFCRDISFEGLGFVHDVELEWPFVLASFGLTPPEYVSLLLEVRWTNEIGPHKYLSGGRFAGVANPPPEMLR